MQGAFYTWKESQVIEKLNLLLLEYKAVSVLNKALKCAYKNIYDFKRDLTNCFDNMKIPGSVIEIMDEPWVDSIKYLYYIAYKEWTDLTDAQKNNYITELEKNAASAWDYICHSYLLLPAYFKIKGMFCAENEANIIYEQLDSVQYSSSSGLFEKTVKELLGDLSFERNKDIIFSLWKKKTGKKSVSDWCNNNVIPVHWVLTGEEYKYAILIKRLEDNDFSVNSGELQKAIDFFEDELTLSVLNDKAAIKQKFFLQIGVGNQKGYEEYEKEILQILRIKMGADVYSWGTRAGEIRNIIEEHLKHMAKKMFAEKAKQRIAKMPEADLKKLVLSFLEEHPEFNELFYNGKIK
jgi:hypothetical protein